MKRFASGLLVLAVCGLFVVPAHASDAFPYGVSVHNFQPGGFNVCGDAGASDASLTCQTINHTGANVAVLIVATGIPAGTDPSTEAVGIGGIEFGVSYSGIDGGAGFTSCTGGSTIAGPGWPASGSSAAVSWPGGCYEPADDGPETRVGFFQRSGNGSFAIIEAPAPAPFTNATSCAGPGGTGAFTFRICAQKFGRADLGDGSGGDPRCAFKCAVPTEEASWGTIKSLFAN